MNIYREYMNFITNDGKSITYYEGIPLLEQWGKLARLNRVEWFHKLNIAIFKRIK